jgi:outer membrane lipopolysaccharide assembly protein LptE/RlpB
MQRRRFLQALLSPLALPLGGCGFHLRGSSSAISLASVLGEVAIDGVDIEIGFGRRLAEALMRSGVKVHPKPVPGVPVLEVGEVDESRRVLSVDRDVRAREYALISEVRFRLLPEPDAAEGAWHAVETRRDLVVDPFQVLGSEQEENRMRREMEEDLVQRIVLVLRQQKK